MNIASEIEQAIRDVKGSDLSNGRKVELVAELLIAYCKALTAELE